MTIEGWTVQAGRVDSQPHVGHPGSAAMTRGRVAATAAALTTTFGIAGASWVVAVRQMHGMGMGVATRLGSFGFFVTVWVSMMAAMMLPGAAPAAVRRARASVRSGSEFGLYCVGSSIGLMLRHATDVKRRRWHGPHHSCCNDKKARNYDGSQDRNT